MRDIVTLASLSPEIQPRVIAKVQEGKETDIKNGTLKVQREERDKVIKEEQDRKKRDVEELQQQIYDLWLACETQTNIADITGIAFQRVSEIIAEKSGSTQVSETGKFRDFEQENSALRIYDIWNFSKATNEVDHFYILFFGFNMAQGWAYVNRLVCLYYLF